MIERGQTFDDLGREAILHPLFETLRPTSALICWIDQEPEPDVSLPAVRTGGVGSCTPADLRDALDRGEGSEVVWLRGYPTWHAVRAVTTTIAAHVAARAGAAPVIVVEGGPADAAPLERAESTKEGIRLALERLAPALGVKATVLWCAPGRGAGAWIPSTAAARMQPWLDQVRLLLEPLRLEHRARVELDARNFALFELLDQSQRDGTALVRSA
ncbi:MAG TPA: hypothetical protein VL769_01995, partial [Acidimicrobiia bacterium]|nr:hypothetical protein [Acidimicrobiia bacterium]